jgi:hypothetical protein
LYRLTKLELIRTVFFVLSRHADCLGIGPHALEPQCPREEILFLVSVERGKSGGASHGVGGNGIALIYNDRIVRPPHEHGRPCVEPRACAGSVNVRNANNFVLTDKYDGIRYTFQPGQVISIPAAVAKHIFGWNEQAPHEIDLMYTAERLGWDRKDIWPQARQWLKRFIVWPAGTEPVPMGPVPVRAARPLASAAAAPRVAPAAQPQAEARATPQAGRA